MNIGKKRVVSLFIALVLVLSFSVQTLATDESPALTQGPMTESTVNERLLDTDPIPDPKLDEVGLGDSGQEEKPQLDTDPKLDEVSLGASGQEEKPQPEPDLKPDPKPDEVTLGASGQEEQPAAEPTITPFATSDFVLTNHGDGFGPILSMAGASYSFDLSLSFSFDSHRFENLPGEEASEVSGPAFYVDVPGDGIDIPYDLGKALTFSLGEGRHLMYFRRQGGPLNPGYLASAQVLINIVETTAAPAVSGSYKNNSNIPVNPTSLTLEHTGATVPLTLAQSGTALTYEWQIVRDSDLNTIDSGTITFDKGEGILSGAVPSNDILKGLETGSYALRQKSVATTRHGNHTGHGVKLPKGVANFDAISWIEVPFIIVKPAPVTLINNGTTDVINPPEIDPVTSPTKITVNSKHPLHVTDGTRDDETQASVVTWQLFKKDAVGDYVAVGAPTSFEDGKKTADVTVPSGLGGYKVVVSETIAGVPGTAEGYFRFPSSFVAVQYWIDDGSGTLESSETWTSPVAWPSKTEGKPNASQATIGMTIPQHYELIRVEEVLTDGTSTKAKVNSYEATYPPDGETTTIKYIYKKKGELVFLNVPSLQFGTHVMASKTMTYPLTQEAVLSVKDNRVTTNNWKVSVSASQFTEVNGTRTLDPDTLGFTDNGEFRSLKESKIVWSGSTNLINQIHNKTWQEENTGDGFVVKVLPFSTSATSFSAVMTWSLQDIP